MCRLNFVYFLGSVALFLSSFIAYAAEVVDCAMDTSQTEELKSILLSGDVEKISQRSRFPVEILFAGNKIKVVNDVSFKYMWPKIATEEFLGSLQSLDACELASVMHVDVAGSFSSLVLFYDEEDTRYRDAYISSAKVLSQFLMKANDWVQAGDFNALFELVSVPFKLKVGEQEIEVKNQQDFFKYSKVIFNDSLRQTIEQASLGKGIIINSRGLMLTVDGELWVRQFEGRLKLVFTVVER